MSVCLLPDETPLYVDDNYNYRMQISFFVKMEMEKINLSLQKFFLFYYSTKISLDSFLSNFIRSNHLEFLFLSNFFPEKLILFIYLKVAQKYPFDFNIIYSCDPFQIIILPIKHEEFERKRLNRD